MARLCSMCLKRMPHKLMCIAGYYQHGPSLCLIYAPYERADDARGYVVYKDSVAFKMRRLLAPNKEIEHAPTEYGWKWAEFEF